ncbi:hypothetical protein FA15DRAFT_661248 [Coprinopsis marcescibilis]|uniref:Uncharacterized protein n=1 Tax=Coprinopsis marcescibilis TaxID=230819 RepID=A0A5C3KC90_COPMA|nr:hypothetical protein FA15DRAFT_661248 [Coprinopsis marcescibilis]
MAAQPEQRQTRHCRAALVELGHCLPPGLPSHPAIAVLDSCAQPWSLLVLNFGFPHTSFAVLNSRVPDMPWRSSKSTPKLSSASTATLDFLNGVAEEPREGWKGEDGDWDGCAALRDVLVSSPISIVVAKIDNSRPLTQSPIQHRTLHYPVPKLRNEVQVLALRVDEFWDEGVRV